MSLETPADPTHDAATHRPANACSSAESGSNRSAKTESPVASLELVREDHGRSRRELADATARLAPLSRPAFEIWRAGPIADRTEALRGIAAR